LGALVNRKWGWQTTTRSDWYPPHPASSKSKLFERPGDAVWCVIFLGTVVTVKGVGINPQDLIGICRTHS